ncbi:MAG: gamma carbonic anhydrase family protein [Pseudomonadota bacterium]
MPIVSIPGKTPRIHETAFIADSACVIGDVSVGPQSGIWFGTVLRGDVHFIRVGARTNIQDLCVVHVTKDDYPAILEDDVTVGHQVTLHGCHVKSRALVGMGATLLDGVVVESGSVIAAGALVAPGTHVPPGVLMMGAPAKPKRNLTEEERNWIMESAKYYVEYQGMYR